MHQTRLLRKMASTHCGMRRILKKRLSPVQFLQKSVQTGIYKELHQNERTNYNSYNNSSKNNNNYNNNNNGNFRNAKPKFAKYPIEYEILSMNPPIPQPPRVPLKMLRKQKASLPTDKYVQSYMRRYDARMRASRIVTPEEEEEYRQRKILGIPMQDGSNHNNNSNTSTSTNTSTSSIMGRKSQVLQDAYEFALRQYQIIQEKAYNDDEQQLDEKTSIQMVEELLQQEERNERLESRLRARQIREEQGLSNAKTLKAHDKDASSSFSSSSSSSTTTNSSTHNENTDNVNHRLEKNTIPSILHSKPRTIQALNIWGSRLRAVPYAQWTLGASTALDHWIAVDVLGMSEESWNRLLEGRLETDVQESRVSEDDTHVNIGDMARVKDIITVRSALFPETLFDTVHQSMDSDAHGDSDGLFATTTGSLLDAHQDVEKDETERSIDELLASLGGFEDEENDHDDSNTLSSSSSGQEDSFDSKVSSMIDSLQDWRAKHQENPYESWDDASKTEFKNWLSKYIALVDDGQMGQIDLKATREALLSEPPRYRADSDSFWSQIEDETDAELLLIHLHKQESDFKSKDQPQLETPAQKKAKDNLETFLSLPYSKQLAQIINLSTLRPILDEYASEVDRLKFMEEHGELLLEGMEIEHLVSDVNGTISLNDIDDSFVDKKTLGENSRFSIKMIPYGTDEFGLSRSERSRALYRAWSAQKAGRARYEENSFKRGELGLSIHDYANGQRKQQNQEEGDKA